MRFDATDEADLFRQDWCFDHEVTGCYFRQFGDFMQFPFDFKYLLALIFIIPQLTTILIVNCKFRRHGINFSNWYRRRNPWGKIWKVEFWNRKSLWISSRGVFQAVNLTFSVSTLSPVQILPNQSKSCWINSCTIPEKAIKEYFERTKWLSTLGFLYFAIIIPTQMSVKWHDLVTISSDSQVFNAQQCA